MTDLIATNDNFFSLIQHSNLADSTKAQYLKALNRALENGVNLADSGQVKEYARTIPLSGQRLLKSALKLWSKEMANQAKGSATPENISAIQATLYRLDSLNESIQVPQSKGNKTHTWLSRNEVISLYDFCSDDSPKCFRDRVVIALMLGTGLRRNELVNLRFGDIKIQPIKGRNRTVLSVVGKGAKGRTIPINDKLAKLLTDWKDYIQANDEDFIARSISKGGSIGERISAIGIFNIVNDAGRSINKPELAPHDIRRTFAQLAYEASVPITQISKLLGHSSIETTQRYLNLDIDLETTASDFIPMP